MRARHLLTACVILITVSIFVIPGTIYVGISKTFATEMSSVLLLAGIVSAMLTVNQDAREGLEAADDRARRR